MTQDEEKVSDEVDDLVHEDHETDDEPRQLSEEEMTFVDTPDEEVDGG